MVSAIRIWASDDGESHLEDVDLAFQESADLLPSQVPIHLTHLEKASGYFVARVPPGLELDWHPAEMRQLAVYLSGHGVIEASDGTTRPLEPGTILLGEDTTGKGHRNRVIGDEEVLVVIVTLPEDQASE